MVLVGPPLLASGENFGSRGEFAVPRKSEAIHPLLLLFFPTRLKPLDATAPNTSGPAAAMLVAMIELAGLALAVESTNTPPPDAAPSAPPGICGSPGKIGPGAPPLPPVAWFPAMVLAVRMSTAPRLTNTPAPFASPPLAPGEWVVTSASAPA